MKFEGSICLVLLLVYASITLGTKDPEQGQSPYVFEDKHFITGMQTPHGRIRFLEKFTDRSKLLRGIENYRISTLEADPQTFTVPSHWDSDAVFFVTNGWGTISLIKHGRRESFNLRQGDIVRVEAGTTTYLINRDNKQKFVFAKILRPVNNPGQFEPFYVGGGDNPDSVYSALSNEILEAAFNTRRERLERVFGKQKQGVIIKASEEQIRALAPEEEEEEEEEEEGSREKLINIYKQHPIYSNQYGQLYHVDSSQYKKLQDLDVSVSLANITQGGMTTLYYNSKSTMIAIVVGGEGYFEMARPDLSRSSQELEDRPTGPSYKKVSSRLRRATVIVAPAGYPFILAASRNQNLQVLAFKVNAYKNQRVPLIGRRSVVSHLERQAKELAFGISAREVDEVFGKQQEEFFFKGPQQQHQGFSVE
ncbi:hypothetical protein ACJIZ3_018612 [Penstemon smallii]|uniref:Cupin type-1 domain-containing protein n=1 Tax=Penstemon smallii TaxID=265156 RepID=A0ABD3SZQ5_9LAMI